jgi:hypothetical protein
MLSSSSEGPHGFESVYKMNRHTFSYICSLVRIPFFEDTLPRDYTFVDGRVMSLQDLVAVALRVLSSGELPEIVGASIGLDESTASLVTQRFVKAMAELALRHLNWPHTNKMGKITRKFDKIHGLPNCCGVVHITRIKLGPLNNFLGRNEGVLMQAVNDPDMRFTNIWLCSLPRSMNQSSILHDSDFFKDCEMGTWLNGNKMKLSDGSNVGEYIIGDSGYPLRPWLLTPYKLKIGPSLTDSKVEFNRRHSRATATVMLRAVARLNSMWKCLQGKGWHPDNELEIYQTISACCLLHNIVIDMEEDDADKHYSQEEISYINQVRHIADEDAVRVRDALSQHLIQSRGKLIQLFNVFVPMLYLIC